MFANCSNFCDVQEVRSSVWGLKVMFGEVRSSVLLRTFGDHKSSHFLPNLTGFLETILNENELNSEKVQFRKT